MSDIYLDFSNACIDDEKLSLLKESALSAKTTLLDGTGAGCSFCGWVDLPVSYDRIEFERIKKAAAKIRSDSEAFVVIGIGGSYLGSRAAIEFLSLPSSSKKGIPDIYYSGNSLSTDSITRTIEAIGDRDFSINVISKSGTTTETAIAFRIFRDLLIKKYGKEEAARRIYATTDAHKGALKSMADKNGYETFVVPDNIGGRYSVLSAVGLLPIAVSGADIDALMAGAAAMRDTCINAPFEDNPALKYAAFRHAMMKDNKEIEVFCIYNPSIHSFSGWWRQLFGESEGKDGKGLFPACVTYSTDLHAIGQFIQDGSRVMFETMLFTRNAKSELIMSLDEDDSDGLNYLAGKSMGDVNDCAVRGTAKAHADGGTPNILISYETKDAYNLGQLFYFFEFSCAVSGYMLGVNPFDQPGVEFYKRNMFRLLGKPGYEK